MKFIARYGEGLVKWMLQLGENARVESPEILKMDMFEMIDKIRNLYNT